MKRLEFDDLVARLEARYAGRTAALARRTLAWVAVGLLGLISWVVVLLVLGAGLLAAGAVAPPPLNVILLAAGAGAAVYGLCQAAYVLRVEPAPRPGRRLRPGEAPALDAALADLARGLRCRPFGEVLLTSDFNAGVYQVPRLGFLGWPRTHLEVGLPLALALGPDELRAVLAHECAHLSARHGRRNGRLYLLHQTWGNLIGQMQRPVGGRLDRAGRWALGAFLGWYWPRLHARALVLSRAHEYEADRLAADLTGGAELASALWRVECYGPWLAERFWPDLWQQTRDVADPPADVYGRLAEAYRAGGPAPEDAARHVERGLSRVAAREDTHPAFLDRARALGLTAEDVRRAGLPPPPPVSAAEALLGPKLADFTRELSEQWRGMALAAWRDRHRRSQAEAKSAAAAGGGESDVRLLWEAARELAGREGLGPVAPLLRQVLARDPGHAGAGVLLGRHLVGLADPEGERLLSAVVARGDEAWLRPACEALEEHYRGLGLADRVRETRAALDRHEADCRAARKERAAVTARDRLLAHGLDDGPLAALRALRASAADVGAAWLARKELAYFPHRPLFVLCVRAAGGRWSGGADRDQALARRLAAKVELPGQVLVVGRRGPFRALARKVAALPGAEVFGPARP
jgi:Zn-dependent protease with chaperone function